jgi:hypothetical protein
MELVGICGKEEKEMVSGVSVVMEVEKEDRVPVGTMVLVERMVSVGTVVLVEKVLGKEMGKEVTIGILELMEPTTELFESTLHLLDL